MGRWMALALAGALLCLAPAADAEDEPAAADAAPAEAETPAAEAAPEAADDGDKAKDKDGEEKEKKKPTVIVKTDHRPDPRLPFMTYGRVAPTADKPVQDVTPLPQRIVTVTGAAVACGEASVPVARLELTGPAPEGSPAPTRSAELQPDGDRRVYAPAAGEPGFETAQLGLTLTPPPAEPCIMTMTGRVERDLRPPETAGGEAEKPDGE